MKKILNNLFQPSTLKAVLSLVACFGITIPEGTVQTLSWAYMGAMAIYESLRDENKKK